MVRLVLKHETGFRRLVSIGGPLLGVAGGILIGPMILADPSCPVRLSGVWGAVVGALAVLIPVPFLFLQSMDSRQLKEHGARRLMQRAESLDDQRFKQCVHSSKLEDLTNHLEEHYAGWLGISGFEQALRAAAAEDD